MNILCSSTGEELSEEDCLTCARDHINPPCGFDESLLRVLYSNAARTGIHVTDLTGCLKMAYLKRTSPMPEFPHEMLTRTLGTLVHGILENNGGEHAEIEVNAEGIVGRTDMYKDGRVLDYKTVRWMYPDKLPYGSHSLQVNLYGYLLKKMGYEVTSLAIQYIDMSGPTKCRKCRVLVKPDIFGLSCPKCGGEPKNAHLGAVIKEIPIMPEEDLKVLIDEKRNELETALQIGITPAAEPSFLCGYCSFQPMCEEGQNFTE